jgi:hypothetical protein
MQNQHIMKRLLYISIILTALSCKRDPLITYNTEDNVYFNYTISANYYVDSTNFSFAYRDASVQDTILLVPLGVTGAPAATDRRYNLVVDAASTAVAGTHYELPEPVIHAGKVEDTLRLHLKRATDLTAGVKKLILHLQPNEFFKTQLQYRVVHTAALDTANVLTFSITMSDILDEGPFWNDSYAAFFGTFSLKKVRFIHDLLGMPLDFWSVFPDNQRRTVATYYASSTSRYLSDQAAQGNIIYDEDGTPMTMGAGY